MTELTTLYLIAKKKNVNKPEFFFVSFFFVICELKMKRERDLLSEIEVFFVCSAVLLSPSLNRPTHS